MSETRNPWLEIVFLGSPPAECYTDTVRDRMKQHSPPYSAIFAGKGDEKPFPWMVVGAPGWNMLGVLMSRPVAEWCAAVMSAAALAKASPPQKQNEGDA